MDFNSLYQSEITKLGQHVLEAPWENKDYYASWLAQTYYFAKDTTRLLMLCGSRISRDQQKLHLRFIDHVSEERGHEFMLLRDLKCIGRELGEIDELPITAGFYQSQYYWIEHQNPSAFFGYILALEGLGSEFGAKIYERAQRAHGEKAVTFLRVHATEDVDHTTKALAILKELPPETMKLVAENFRLAIGFYMEIVERCKEFASAQGKKAA